MKYRVTLSQLRWEHYTRTLEAESPEAAATQAEAMNDMGLFVPEDDDFDCGDVFSGMSPDSPAFDVYEA